MNFYVYKITNIHTGKIYIGKRKCSCNIEDDKYMGSGYEITTDIAKLGLDKFKKEILKVVDNEKDCYKHEAELIKEYASKGFDMYNIQGICKEEETRTYTMRIDVELYKKLEEEAVRRRRSVNFIVNEKIERAYKKQKKNK